MKAHSRKAVIYVLCWGLLFLLRAYAFQNAIILDEIRPGLSSRTDMHALLGEPKKLEVSADVQIEHFDAKEKLFGEITLFFSSTEILQWARLCPLHPIDSEDAPLLFVLTSEPETEKGHAFDQRKKTKGETRHFQEEGIHFYVQDGVVKEIWLTQVEIDLGYIIAVLEQAAPEPQSGVNSQISKAPEESQQIDTDQNIASTASGEVNYLGAHYVQNSGKGIKLVGIVEDSPAQHAGLQEGDIILEIEEGSIHERVTDPSSFTGVMAGLPSDRPLKFLVERKGKKFDVWIKLEKIDGITARNLLEKSRRELLDDFAQGRQHLLSQNYAAAIPYLTKSLKSRPHDSHQTLGICYYHTGRFKEAEKHSEEAYKLDKTDPLSTFYLAASLDQRNKEPHAVRFYEKYLRLNHDNPDMNAYASSRLQALKNKQGQKNREALQKIIDAVLKEIKK